MEATDRLRNAIRGGLTVGSSVTLIAYLFRSQAHILSKITEQLEADVGRIEDQILADKIRDQRGKLGKIRRLATRLIRHFTPEHRLLRQVSRRFPSWFNAEDRDDFEEIIESFGEVMNELDAVNERTKLLQEELYTKITEETNRNLFVLSIVTTVFMPISVITGIFGMNVAGLPGLENTAAFWWVIAGMTGVAVLTLVILHWKRIF